MLQYWSDTDTSLQHAHAFLSIFLSPFRTSQVAWFLLYYTSHCRYIRQGFYKFTVTPYLFTPESSYIVNLLRFIFQSVSPIVI